MLVVSTNVVVCVVTLKPETDRDIDEKLRITEVASITKLLEFVSLEPPNTLVTNLNSSSKFVVPLRPYLSASLVLREGQEWK